MLPRVQDLVRDFGCRGKHASRGKERLADDEQAIEAGQCLFFVDGSQRWDQDSLIPCPGRVLISAACQAKQHPFIMSGWPPYDKTYQRDDDGHVYQ